MRNNLKIWRESASLILAARSRFDLSPKCDYKILSLKRSLKSQFMPETYVFPGGNLSKSDSDLAWLALYENFGFSSNAFKNLASIENVPEILQSNNQKSDELPKYLSLRICAIRETFEECGILLCKTRSPQINYDVNSSWASFIGGHDLIKWQHKIHDDSNEFLSLCKKYSLYPDIWSLHMWSNWATPPSLPQKFNTLFFLATLPQMPVVHSDEREIQNLMWATPEHCIALNNKKTIMLPAPQFYEISRLRTFSDVSSLLTFAKERAKKGCETYLPHRINTTEGLYSILPGDCCYPKHFDKTNRDVPFMAELPCFQQQNRILHLSQYHSNKIMIKNVHPKCDHIIPVI